MSEPKNVTRVDFAKEKAVWQCNCGCILFLVTPSGYICNECDTYQISEEE
jgi:hypothetical protein